MQRKKILLSFLIVFLVLTFHFASIHVVYAATSFGYDAIGASTAAFEGGMKFACKFTLTEDADVYNITCRVSGNNWDANNPYGVIYTDNAGAPSTLKATTLQGSGIGAMAWLTYTFASPVALTAGVWWLGLIRASPDDMSVRYSAGTTDQCASNTDSPPPSDPFGTPTYDDFKISIYANYTATGGVTEYTFQGNFAPTFTFRSTRTWQFGTYRTIPFSFVFDSVIKSSITGLTTLTFYGDILGTFALNQWNTYAFTSLHSFTMTFASSLNRFVSLNTINTFGFAFTLNQIRQWQFTTHRTIPFQFTLQSISKFAYTLPGLLTFYGDITATFTLNKLKEIGFTREQTIPFTFTMQTATNMLQLGIIIISSAIGFTFQLLSTQYGLAQLTLESIYAIAGLALILAISMPVAFFMLKRRKD